MIYFIDTDFISKIISFDLIDEFLSTYSITKSNLRIVHHEKIKTLSLIDSYHLTDEKKKRHKNFINTLPVITSKFDDIGLLQKLQKIPGIDSGEQTLLFYLKNEKKSFCLTADHKFLDALISNIIIVDIVKLIQNRILVLEQVIIKIVEIHSFSKIKDKLYNGKSCDAFLNSILSNRSLKEDRFIELLETRCIDFKDILYNE